MLDSARRPRLSHPASFRAVAFKVLACPAPNTYTCPELNLERLRPISAAPLTPAPSSPTVAGEDGRPEHEVQELLKFKMRYGRPYVLVHWAGCDASGDT
jgi:hypothetical protein